MHLLRNFNTCCFTLLLLICNIFAEAQVSADFSSDLTSVCTNSPVVFTFTGFGNITSYKWSFGTNAYPDSAFTVGPHSVIFTSAGTQTVTLVVTDGTNSDSKTININTADAVSADFTFSGPQNIIPTFIIFGPVVTTASAYNWNFSSPTTSPNTSTVQNPSAKYIYGGSYLPCLTTDNNGCKMTVCKPLVITAGSSTRKADFTVSPSAGTCVGNKVTFTDMSANMSTSVRSWDFGAGASPPSFTGLVPPAVSWNTPGDKIIVLTVGSGATTSNIKVKAIDYEVYPYPTSDFNITSGDPCNVPAALTFMASAGSGNSYAWNFGDGTGSTSSAPNKMYASSGTYDVTLTTTRKSCSSVLTRKVVIGNGCNPALQAGLEAMPSENACLKGVYTFTDASIGSVTSESWNFGTGASPATASGAGPHTVTYSGSGPHTVTLLVNGSSTVTSIIQ